MNIRLMGETIDQVNEAVQILKNALNVKESGVVFMEQKGAFLGEKGDKLAYGMMIFLPK